MNFNNYTLKAQEVIEQSFQYATANNNQGINNGHLLKSLFNKDRDISIYILKKHQISESNLETIVDNIIKSYPKVEGGNPYISNELNKTLAIAQKKSAENQDKFISTEHLWMGLVENKDQVGKLLSDLGISDVSLKTVINELTKGKKVDSQTADNVYHALDKYALNLNVLAASGKLDPVIGRDEEIRRVLQVLSRRTKNNPILIGEPGVGKTAIAEGIAHRIINGDVPENLKSKKIFSLDMGSLVAGAKYKGEFEERLKAVVKEVIDSDGEIVLFIDEIHTLVGAGKGEGAMDAANILKPALARGELRAIGATTLNEYQKYFEKDKALERRFQIVMVEEPDMLSSISILRGLKERYETHHKVRIQDDAIIAAVELSERYINDRFLPDKAIDLIDEAASKLRLEMNSVPEIIDELQRSIMQMEIEREAIKREGNILKLDALKDEISKQSEELNAKKAKWEAEKIVINELQTCKQHIEELKLEADQAEREGNYGKVAEIRYGKIKELEEQIASLNIQIQKANSTNSLIREEVTPEDIAEVIARWTKIPVKKMMQTEREKLLHLEYELHQRVVGQNEAIEAISDAVRRSRAGLQDVNRPIGSFIFLGTTGVGKTELAKALADFLFANESHITRIDMSEYQERHSVSRLIGAPPGYVGYDEGGQLTEAVRRKPYSVVLLDEIEKAHPDVFNILLQVLDDGRLTDNKGRVVNFKNTIIIMTSNTGSHLIQQEMEHINDENRVEVINDAKKKVFELLKQTIKPEFLNRVDELIMFTPLSLEDIRQIVEIQFRRIQEQLMSNQIAISITPESIDWIAKQGYDPTYGARPIKRLMQKTILNDLSKAILSENVKAQDKIVIDVKNGSIVFNN